MNNQIIKLKLNYGDWPNADFEYDADVSFSFKHSITKFGELSFDIDYETFNIIEPDISVEDLVNEAFYGDWFIFDMMLQNKIEDHFYYEV